MPVDKIQLEKLREKQLSISVPIHSTEEWDHLVDRAPQLPKDFAQLSKLTKSIFGKRQRKPKYLEVVPPMPATEGPTGPSHLFQRRIWPSTRYQANDTSNLVPHGKWKATRWMGSNDSDEGWLTKTSASDSVAISAGVSDTRTAQFKG